MTRVRIEANEAIREKLAQPFVARGLHPELRPERRSVGGPHAVISVFLPDADAEAALAESRSILRSGDAVAGRKASSGTGPDVPR